MKPNGTDDRTCPLQKHQADQPITLAGELLQALQLHLKEVSIRLTSNPRREVESDNLLGGGSVAAKQGGDRLGREEDQLQTAGLDRRLAQPPSRPVMPPSPFMMSW